MCCTWCAGLASTSASLHHVEADRDTAQARVAELEGQVEAMIEQMGSGRLSGDESALTAQLQNERDAAQNRIAELEGQVLSCFIISITFLMTPGRV